MTGFEDSEQVSMPSSRAKAMTDNERAFAITTNQKYIFLSPL